MDRGLRTVGWGLQALFAALGAAIAIDLGLVCATAPVRAIVLLAAALAVARAHPGAVS